MKKGANSEKALNENALSEALISIDKVSKSYRHKKVSPPQKKTLKPS